MVNKNKAGIIEEHEEQPMNESEDGMCSLCSSRKEMLLNETTPVEEPEKKQKGKGEAKESN